MSKIFPTIFFAVCIFVYGGTLSVVEARSLSITPTILEMFASPGQIWNGSIKVINQNSEPLTVYAETMNFAPQGERGHGQFAPIIDTQTDGSTLAEWLQVSDEPFAIPPEGTVTVPVTMRVPADAAPGGHYAAVMIGTRPPSDTSGQVGTSQVISSLFFVRIAGDIVERGKIRSFRPANKFVQTPELEFSLRFENAGNVHLRPQGEIVIRNMWGRERGIIPINQKTNFGNVLPESIREFEFTWSGEPSFSDIGRYEATLALGYGTDQRTFLTSRTHFWVVPVKPLLILLGSLLGIIWFASWCVRAYVRRMLLLSGVNPDSTDSDNRTTKSQRSLSRLRAPLQDGVIDLRTNLQQSHNRFEFIQTIWRFVVSYRKFFFAIVGGLLVIAAVWWYLASVFVPNRNFDVTIDTNGQPTTYNSEEILYDRNEMFTDRRIPDEPRNETYTISVTNTTDTPGRAVSVATILEDNQYQLEKVTADTTEPRTRSVILYRSQYSEEALALSTLLDGVLLSALPESDTASNTDADIRIYIGED